MNKNFRVFVAGLTCGVILMVSVPLAAKTGKKAIEVVYNNIKLEVNGIKAHMPEGIEPFMFNGTTYLPVRAVAEALGEVVNYDKSTATVQVGSAKSNVSREIVDIRDFISERPIYSTVSYNQVSATDDRGSKRNYIKIRQKKVPFTSITSIYGGTLFLNSDYSKLKARFAIKDGSNNGPGQGSCIISIKDNKGDTIEELFHSKNYMDKYGGSFSLKGGFEPFEIELNVIGSDNLYISTIGDAVLLDVQLVPLSRDV